MPLQGFMNKLQEKYQDKIPQQIRDKLPPQIPFSNKPAPPVPSSSKPSLSAVPASSYWRADFSPSIPVSANFGHECGDWGWGNNELENYTDSPENSFHTSNNCLVIRARIASKNSCDKYTSARLTSHQRLARRRGYIEATISPPCAKGIWPAFWLLPADPFKWPEDGEVDIMEAWNGESTNHACLHWGHFNGEDWNKHRVCETVISGITKPHTYGFAWDQPEAGEGGRGIWFIDGKPIMRAQRPPGTRRFEDFRVLLNVAVGGNVCNGAVPKDGSYDMVVHELKMCDEPVGGWAKFEEHWPKTREGRAN